LHLPDYFDTERYSFSYGHPLRNREPLTIHMEGMEPLASVRIKRWTRAEYDRLSAAGYFNPEARLQLIQGEIVEMSPQGAAHATAIRRMTRALETAFRGGHDIRVQLPIALSDDSEPEPDVAVVRGTIEDYEERHPSTAVLIGEVADSTLRFDQTRKLAMYAAAGIPEYWVLNLVDRTLDVHREPFSSGSATFLRLGLKDLVSPLAAPEARLRVADLFPRERG
jgi:Uma2 family endonuclease